MKSRANPLGPHRDGAIPAPGTPGRTPHARVGLRALPLLPVLLLLAACGDDHLKKYPQTAFRPVSEYGRITDDLFHLTLYLGVGVGLIVFALVAYIVFKFRYQEGAPEPKQIHGNTTLELAWTLVPAVILAIIAVPTVRAIFATQPDPRSLGADVVNIDIVGKQWWWEAKYFNGKDTIRTANEIHIPTGRTINLRLHSDNVLHSFWIPQMGGKRDLIPNRVNHIVFKADSGATGIYLGQCAEFCGDSHALMKMRMVAHTPAGYEQWLRHESSPAVQPADSTSAEALGKQLFNQVGCAGCHTIRGHEGAAGIAGPNLTHIGSRRTIAAGVLDNNAENLNLWINDPTGVKPGSKMPKLQWTEDQVRYIVAYLQTLQ